MRSCTTSRRTRSGAPSSTWRRPHRQAWMACCGMRMRTGWKRRCSTCADAYIRERIGRCRPRRVEIARPDGGTRPLGIAWTHSAVPAASRTAFASSPRATASPRWPHEPLHRLVAAFVPPRRPLVRFSPLRLPQAPAHRLAIEIQLTSNRPNRCTVVRATTNLLPLVRSGHLDLPDHLTLRVDRRRCRLPSVYRGEKSS